MPSNYTSNFNLNQWEPDDRVLRTDFNADNAKIDAALGALSAGLEKTVSPLERIYTDTFKGPVTGTGINFRTSTTLKWDEWEYVILLADFEMIAQDANDKTSFITLNDLKTLVTLGYGPCFIVFFPRHDISRTVNGFVIGNGAKYFSSQLTYENFTQLDIDMTGNYDHKMKNIRLTLLGGR